MDAIPIPRITLPLAPPPPRVLTEWMSTRDPRHWPDAPDGDGQPVMLVPGFMAGDTSLTRMALWLRGGGYTLARSGINRNTGCMEETIESLENRLEQTVDRLGRRSLLIGQSRGGVIGRALAVLRPDLVETLVTLGSPLRDQLAVKARIWPSLITVGALGTVGVPNMFGVSCLRGDCCERSREAVAAPFPGAVRFLSFYSRTDEIVRWSACLDPAAKQIEVQTSHIGMGMAREVWSQMTAALAAPVAAA
ncbi:MAG TPA: alpha/beta hydrolase [Solirubrobacteraceae bacterium]|nr:alpha/beta hydrolase [Solirubrobacteraceae bacterium]